MTYEELLEEANDVYAGMKVKKRQFNPIGALPVDFPKIVSDQVKAVLVVVAKHLEGVRQ